MQKKKTAIFTDEKDRDEGSGVIPGKGSMFAYLSKKSKQQSTFLISGHSWAAKKSEDTKPKNARLGCFTNSVSGETQGRRGALKFGN